MELRPREAIRLVVFGVMLIGLAVSIRGQLAELNSFNLRSDAFAHQQFAEHAERTRAYEQKTGGIVLVFAGPLIWAIAAGFRRRQERAARSSHPTN
jgi:hypothetical protein